MIAFPKRLLILTQLLLILLSTLFVIPSQKTSAIAGGDMNFPSGFEETLNSAISVKFLDPYHIQVEGAPGIKLFSNPTWPSDVTYATILNTIYTIGEGCTWTQNYTIEFNDGERDRSIEINAVIKKGKYEGQSSLRDAAGALGTAVKWSSYLATFGATALAEYAVDSTFSSDGNNECDLPSAWSTDQALVDYFPSGEFSQHNLTIRVHEGDKSIYLFEENDDGSGMGWKELDGGSVFNSDYRGLALADKFRGSQAARDGLRLGYAFVNKEAKKIVATYDASKEFLLCAAASDGQRYFQESACNSGARISTTAWNSMTDEQVVSTLSDGPGMFPATLTTSSGDKGIQIAKFDSELSLALQAGLIDSPGGEDGIIEASCEDNDGEFVFFQCAIIRAASDAINELDARVRAALEIKPSYYKNELIRESWSNFRDIAYILLIPALLVMVISTALGYSFVDAYTVKRALPRLIIAIIFIALSFDLCTALIDVTTTIGKGVGGLIATPFGGSDALTLTNIFSPSKVSGAALGGGVISGIALAAVGGVTLGILASYLLVGAISITIIFALLTMREMIILFLLILSPLAILSWIFPGNDKMWKLWWGSFSKLLMIFPLIVGLLVTGRAFAFLMAQTSADGIEGVFLTFAKLVAYVGPFFFIPAAFKFAGGAFANLAGMANDRSRGLFDKQRKYRGESMKKQRAAIASGRGFKGVDPGDKGIRGRLNKLGQNSYVRKNLGLRGYSSTARDAALDRMEIEEKDHASKDVVTTTKLRNDDFAHIVNLDTEAESIKYLVEEKGFTLTAAKKEAAQAAALKREHGVTTLRMMAVDAKSSSKTSYTGGIDEMLEDIMRAAHGDEIMAMTMLGSASQAAMAAGRFDLGGGSYGEKAGMLKAKMRGETTAASIGTDGRVEVDAEGNAVMFDVGSSSAINQRQAGKALDGLTTWELSRMHPTAAKNVSQNIPLDFGRLAENMSNGIDPQGIGIAQKAAHTKTLEAGLSSLPPEVARIMSVGLTDTQNFTPVTIDGQVLNSAQEVVRHFEAGGGSAEAQKAFQDLSRNPYTGMTPAQIEDARNRGAGAPS